MAGTWRIPKRIPRGFHNARSKSRDFTGNGKSPIQTLRKEEKSGTFG
jgi:hypothetical protein